MAPPDAGRAIAEPLLQLSMLAAGYGAARVLHGVTLSVAAGETLVVVGRNGVGKTTLLETIMGLTTHHGGEIKINGRPVETLPPYRRNHLGIAWVPQQREVFPSLTVRENLNVVARPGHWDLRRVYDMFPRLSERQHNFGNQLSGGEQQMLAIGRALMTNPSLLLLDEPVEGLAPIIVLELMQAIERMRVEGNLAIMLVEQKYDIALAHSNRCVVLDHGKVVHAGDSAALRADQGLIDRLLGLGM